jgi:DNA-binding response OmpR family regulator
VADERSCVLLVSGEADEGETLRDALTARGFEVRTAAPGDAIDFDPDVLVIDLRTTSVGAAVASQLGLRGDHDRGDASIIVIDDVVIDVHGHAVTRGGKPVPVTATEFALIVALARKRGHVVSKAALVAEVWADTSVSENVVEVHLSSLRRKLEDLGPRVIHTVRGVGYRM